MRIDLNIPSTNLKANFFAYHLQFKIPAKTSRDTLTQKTIYIIQIWDAQNPNFIAQGECSPLLGLSVDNPNNYTEILQALCEDIQNYKFWLQLGLKNHPSIKMGLEMAILNLKNQTPHVYFPSDFTLGKKAIEINGLIWMGEYEGMRQQIIHKINQGFTCVKLKIGGIDFDNELKLLELIRKDFSAKDIELRLDANGSMKNDEVFYKLDKLSKYHIHSIEQPIATKQWEFMHDLCAQSPIDIALDEELIGVEEYSEKEKLIRAIQPKYLIFKPSLLGGFVATKEWIDLCAQYQIKWWITSALESNLGLNAIAQFAAITNNNMPQGLGTGGLFTNNLEAPIQLVGKTIQFTGSELFT
jgi:O-succinylbenzoate synthase